MNKSQQKVVNYAKVINHVVETTEETGSKLNPFYEQVKTAMDEKKLAEMKSSEYQTILNEFTEGVEQYKGLLNEAQAAIAPPRVMGIHRQFLKAFEIYYQGCADMLVSLHDNQTCDEDKFIESGKVQDDASEQMGHYIEKISKLLF